MRLPDDHHQHDPRDRALSDRLDELGLADGSKAGPMLEDRVIAGVAAVFAPAPIAITPARRAWHQRAAFRVPFAMAAGLAIVAGVGVFAWPAGGPEGQGGAAGGPGMASGVSPTLMHVAMVEQRIDGLLALTGDPGSASGGSFEDRVASIELWADALASETDSAWLGSDLADPAWYEGGWSELNAGEGAL